MVSKVAVAPPSMRWQRLSESQETATAALCMFGFFEEGVTEVEDEVVVEVDEEELDEDGR